MAIHPKWPTRHLPGTRGKKLVMQGRAFLKLPLFHPDDAKIPEGDDPSQPEVTVAVDSESLDPRQLRENYKQYLEGNHGTN